MKNLLYIIILSVFIVSCNSTKPAIITTKKEAIKKKQYDADVNTAVVKKVRKPKQKTTDETDVEIPSNKPVETEEINDGAVFKGSRGLIEDILFAAKENIGVPYRMGGLTKAGLDCSGLLYTTFKQFDISLPRTSGEMAQTGYTVSKNEAKKGDLIFFVTRGSRISHVGLITEVKDDGEIKFIHSSTSSGVMISSLNETYYNTRFARIKRILD